MNFLNPYHFVPVYPVDAPQGVPIDGYDRPSNTTAHLTHDRYLAEGYSGRVVCCLTTESPLVVGAKQTKGDPTRQLPGEVEPFLIGNRPVIPASSLRGLISSVAEAASHSALRVLGNRRGYSYRRTMSEGLSALGMIVEHGDGAQKRLMLRPLSIPHLEAGVNEPFRLSRCLPEPKVAGTSPYARLFPHPNLKVYVGDQQTIRSQRFLTRFQNYRLQDAGPGPFYGLRLADAAIRPDRGTLRQWDRSESLPPQAGAAWHLRPKQSRGETVGYCLLAQNAAAGEPTPWDEALLNQGYVRGIMRVLGVTDLRAKEIPESKEHEIFIPYPREMEDPERWPLVPILPEATERFHELCDERAEAEPNHHPFHPIGTERRRGAKPKSAPEHAFRLKGGDVVYFRPTDDGAAVSELSLSSIWRGRVETIINGNIQAALPADFFARVHPDLLPQGATSSGPAKQRLTLAEEIFGFVEQRDPRRSLATEEGKALAGRVRFSSGALDPGQNDWFFCENPPAGAERNAQGAYLLKVLNSPKPPSPAMYFKRPPRRDRGVLVERGGYVAKRNLVPGEHHPQGRKFYLHRRSTRIEDWVSQDAANPETRALKLFARPLKADLRFWFHVDFHNLTAIELGLLCYALSPTEGFRHKLGLGKPLGLGTVHIQPAGLFLVNRQQRYQSLNGPRYHSVWKSAHVSLPPQYCPNEPSAQQRTPTPHRSFANWRDQFTRDNRMGRPELQQALKVLEHLGDPTKVPDVPIHYPQVEGPTGALLEQMHYEWFVANDDAYEKQAKYTRLFGDPPRPNSPQRPTQRPAALPPVATQDRPGGMPRPSLAPLPRHVRTD